MHRLVRLFGICCLSFTGLALRGQSNIGLVAYYSFDGCDAVDDTGKGADGVISGMPGCVCGVVGNALEFDGVDDFIQFLGSFDLLFSEDFTLSFYMAPSGSSGIVDVVSKYEACTPGNALAMRYEPANGLVRASLSEGLSLSAESRAPVDANTCWQHVAWVRAGLTLRLYINGEQRHTLSFSQDINNDNNGVFSIANGPCLPNGELRYAGYLDELRLYNRALGPTEIEELYTPVDQIASRDTFLFLGNSVQIDLTATCADAFSWNPTAGVVSPFDAEPTISPTVTTKYAVLMDYPFCQATDTILLVVVDSNDVDCESVFIPNAFTPNNDGLNDVFGMSNNFFIGQFESFQIYDRWGTMVFEGLTPDVSWDGTFEGEELLPGIYIYKLRYHCDGEERIRTGSFSLIR